MKIFIKKFLFFVFIIIFCSNLSAEKADYGTTSIFIEGAGARAYAMGNAFTALSDNSEGVFYNPAGLTNLERQHITLFHYPLYEGTLYNSITYAMPILDFGSIGIGVIRIWTSGIEAYDENDFKTGEITFQEYKAAISYAKKINDDLSFGGSLDIFNFSLDKVNAFSFGGDFGVLYEPFSFLGFGLKVENLIKPSITMQNQKEELPLILIGGCILKIKAGAFDLKIPFDVAKSEDMDVKLMAGGEITLFDILSLRAGYNDSRISFGGGLCLAGVSLDYAYIINEYMGGLSRFSLSYKFGLTLSEQEIERKKALKEQVKKLIEEEFRKKELEKAKAYYNEAYNLFKSEKYEEALEKLDNAFEWYESYKEAKELKNTIQKKLLTVYYNRGVKEYKKQNYISALEDFKKVAKINEDYESVKVYMERINEKMKMKGSAREYFSKGVELFVNNQYDEALSQFNKALQIEPDNSMIKTYISKTKTKLRAIAGGRALTDAQISEIKTFYYAGLKKYTAGDLKGAIAEWKKVLQINPSDIKTLKSIEKAQAELAELEKRGIK